jgi:hypothetical protein
VRGQRRGPRWGPVRALLCIALDIGHTGGSGPVANLLAALLLGGGKAAVVVFALEWSFPEREQPVQEQTALQAVGRRVSVRHGRFLGQALDAAAAPGRYQPGTNGPAPALLRQRDHVGSHIPPPLDTARNADVAGGVLSDEQDVDPDVGRGGSDAGFAFQD